MSEACGDGAVVVNVLGTLVRVVLLWFIATQAPELTGLVGRTISFVAPFLWCVGGVLGLRVWQRRRVARSSRRRHPTTSGAALAT